MRSQQRKPRQYGLWQVILGLVLPKRSPRVRGRRRSGRPRIHPALAAQWDPKRMVAPFLPDSQSQLYQFLGSVHWRSREVGSARIDP
jgi:hypothetical protein